MADELNVSLSNLRSIEVDYTTNQATVTLSDDRRTTFAFEHSVSSPVLTSRLNIQEQTLVMTLSEIGEVVVEIAPGADSSDTRPVVYLDQLHWISLAKAIAGTTMPEAERKAAQDLIRLVESGQVILPLSGAHAVEMARASGKWRRDLAGVMLRYSRGWQMLSPLTIRARELRHMFGATTGNLQYGLPTREEVFTRQPRALWADARGEAWAPPGDLPLILQETLQRITWVQSLYAVLAENVANEDHRGVQLAERWAESHHELALHMKGNPRAQLHKRALTRLRFVMDMQIDLAQAAADSGLTPEQFNSWLQTDAEGDLSRLPYLGRMREVIHHRLSNAQDSWESNDLNDLLFLSCAAGYADITVGERKFSGYLQRVNRRMTTSAPVVPNLAAALQLDSLSTLTGDS